MAKPKPCACGSEKAPGSNRYCLECGLRRKSIEIQVAAARFRLEAVPEQYRAGRIPKSQWPEGRRFCAGCQTFVSLEDVPDSGARCRPCRSSSSHAAHIERTYSLTPEDYQALLAAQGGRCYVCQREAHSKRLAVDHDHATGEVRGLLCADSERGCNRAIVGSIESAARTREDALRLVERLREYLEDPPFARLQRGDLEPSPTQVPSRGRWRATTGEPVSREVAGF